MEIFGWLATIAFGICYWPQIYHSYKTKSVGDISIASWLLQLGGYFLGIFYGVWLKQNALIFGYLHGFLCSVIFLSLYWKYRGNR